MANWYRIDLEWLSPPSLDALKNANEWIQKTDWDGPKLTPANIFFWNWRNPMISSSELAKKLQEFGLDCRIFWRHESDVESWFDFSDEEIPWIYSMRKLYPRKKK